MDFAKKKTNFLQDFEIFEALKVLETESKAKKEEGSCCCLKTFWVMFTHDKTKCGLFNPNGEALNSKLKALDMKSRMRDAFAEPSYIATEHYHKTGWAQHIAKSYWFEHGTMPLRLKFKVHMVHHLFNLHQGTRDMWRMRKTFFFDVFSW